MNKKPKTIKFSEEDKEALYRKAFKDAQDDLREEMIDVTDTKAEELAAKNLVALLTVVDFNNIIRVNAKGLVNIGDRQATDIELANLKAEAEFFLQSSLWKIIYESPKELAHRAMFLAGESLDDLKKGRSMLYTLESQKRILEMLKSYKPKKV